MTTSRPYTSAKTKLLMVIGSALFAVLIFVVMDFLTRNTRIGDSLAGNGATVSVAEGPYKDFDSGWYELKPNFSGFDAWGGKRFSVYTDRNGFRRASEQTHDEQADVVFLGDSYAYGINGPWDETFVGKYQSMTGKVVLNTGVSSYSPTAYLYRYKQALAANVLKPGCVVVVSLDISDVQDEASYWTDGTTHPRKTDGALADQRRREALRREQEAERNRRWRYRLPLTSRIYRYLRYPPAADTVATDLTNVLDQSRSAFTWDDWATLDQSISYAESIGYAPLGVRGGLDRIEAKLGELTDLTRMHGSPVYVLIYPWPAQLYHVDKFDWSAHVRDMCQRIQCSGVIDLIPRFREAALSDKDWYQRYFINGDTHFNEAGSKLIATELTTYLSAPERAQPVGGSR